MTRRTLAAAAATFALAAASVAAPAAGGAQTTAPAAAPAPSPRSFHVGLAGGATVPLSDPVTFPSDGATGLTPALGSQTGFHATGFFGYARPTSPLGVRVEFTYHTLKGDDFRFSDPDFGSLSLRPDVRLMGGTLNAVFAPAGGAATARPYVIAGVGMYDTRTTFHAGGSLIENEIGGATSVRQSDTNAGLNGGVGVRFGVGGLGAFVEARLHYVFNEKGCDFAGGEVCLPRDNTVVAPVSFGIMF